MNSNFIKTVDRKNTNSIKWDFIRDSSNFKTLKKISSLESEKPFIPMWVADMDFRSPQEVIDALIQKVNLGIFGYTYASDSYYASIINWMKKRHDWEIDRKWISVTPGVVPALKLAIRAFVKPDEKVLIQPPVYYPFFSAAECNNAKLEFNPLLQGKDRYCFDIEGFEKIISLGGIKVFILCNPHNPVGRVWTKDELLRIGEICLKNNVIVIADEIHSDLIYSWSKFTPFASINKEFADISVSCTSASKTFNLAGFYTSNIIISNAKLKTQFDHTLYSSGANEINLFGFVATEAAYIHGEKWLDEIMTYIEENYLYIESFIKNNIPGIKVFKPEGTYLVWLDISRLGLSRIEFNNLLINKAGIGLDEGVAFGNQGEGFVRLNMATGRTNIEEAMHRLAEVFINRL